MILRNCDDDNDNDVLYDDDNGEGNESLAKL